MVPSGKTAAYAILIAGISREAREMYQEFFTWAGWRVTLAAESTSAFELVAAEQPDVVAMSDRLRPRNGLQLCEQLHADARTTHIPVLMLTTATTTFDRQRARAAGCATLLVPTLPRVLLTEARRLIARGTPEASRGDEATRSRACACEAAPARPAVRAMLTFENPGR
jgi:DNA-binding response OmpR family regulator